tara:strand:+ start:79 stop:267 length:189 start_codon:yes stop_codon:yes gene_type:complete
MNNNNYEISMTIKVDPTANFLEVGDKHTDASCIKQRVCEAIYDIDDVEIKHIEITRRKDDTD